MSLRIPSLKMILSSVAIASFVVGGILVAKNIHGKQHAAPPAAPPASSFARSIGAEGLVEPKSEDIGVAPVVPGQVIAVRVKAQQHVRAGDVLWEQDSRELAAQIPVREAEVTNARAAVAVGDAALADARVQLTLIESVSDRRAIREEDLQRRRIAVDTAKALLAASRATLARATAAVAETRSDLTRRVVVAPIDGQILKVNIRPGEYATVPAPSPLVVMGDTSAMHVRVDVAEEDAPRFAPDRSAYASPRGDATRRIPLEFVRVEPRLIPKRNLSGDTAERIDTRVLQVIYRIAGTEIVYDGELMDVYIDAPAMPIRPTGTGTSTASAGDRAFN
ncbi:HlyD family efflux transporter periplasmic adaptor subunit [Paraburkholderia sp. IMGN_8]|uniref:efflux RND transporter periplasmic adaptor subunit n=1 Tax=Paraburkholderia sp. IMGN_8 TaxID=3136564 RepID=UPI003100F484